ncbi:MAG: biotin/lipoyl-containing protein, partial [Pseudomonadota bacterium]
VVPGYHGAAQEPAVLAEQAREIGYPVLIKARAGGGGKGMRQVSDPADFEAALASAQREAQASFGDPACLIEKYITKPRHVEIQVFADGHGNVVHMFERDCSLQRRHQKVIEEAPAPAMPQDVRAAMGAAAAEAARAIGYVGAGTVEFIADGSGPLRSGGFWFMEMNTRLQVEHPVTEAITGRDLVELQLRVAAGEALPFSQDALAIDGHAIEARIYAEDPGNDFLPVTGTLAAVREPRQATHFSVGPVRIDTAVRTGDTITEYYDPMIAKLIVHAPTRAQALHRLRETLGEFHVAGTVTNLPFLRALAANPAFNSGDVDTGLIAQHLEDLTAPAQAADTQFLLAVAAAVFGGGLTVKHSAAPTGGTSGEIPQARPTPVLGAAHNFRSWGPAEKLVRLALAGSETALTVRVSYAPSGCVTVQAADWERTFDAQIVDLDVDANSADQRIEIKLNGVRRTLTVVATKTSITLLDGGRAHEFTAVDPLERSQDADAATGVIIAPMAGVITQISASAGDAVAAGTALIVQEAMKMEHALTAPRDGVVQEITVEVGEQVADGDVLLVLANEESA